MTYQIKDISELDPDADVRLALCDSNGKMFVAFTQDQEYRCLDKVKRPNFWVRLKLAWAILVESDPK